MKILAVRGENLASLGSPFELNLEEPPLRGAGLFAITGPTGAGKTTILDTICLALFDNVPRFQYATRYQSEEQKATGLSSNDPRNLLRMGTARGFAEVDFRGVDHKNYRARWSVRKAHNKPTGRFQASSMSLTCLENGQTLGDHKTQTKQEIVTRLGLDYHQFCRSVLLAQNEFAAFLKAGVKERAKLLERITGTQIYTKLSISAHERHRDEKNNLDELEREREALKLLPQEDVVQLQELQASCEVRTTQLKARLDALSREQVYHQRSAELKEQIQVADAAIGTTTLALAAVDSEGLQKILDAQPLRSFIENHDRVVGDLQKLEEDQSKVTDRLKQLALEQEQAQKSREDALKALEAVRIEIERRAPELDQARALDMQISERTKQNAEIEKHLEKLRNQYRETHKEFTLVSKEREQTKALQEDLSQWLATHEADVSLAKAWSVWEPQLKPLPKLYADLQRHQQQVPQFKQDHEQSQEKLLALEADLTRLSETVNACDSQAEATNKALQALDAQQIPAAFEALFQQKQVLGRLASNLQQQADQMARAEDLGVRLEDILGRTQSLEVALKEDRQSLETLRHRLAEAQLALRLSKTALDYGQRRHEELHEGKPCPLCGSEDHPYAGKDDPVSQVLHTQQSRVDELIAEERERNEQRIRQSSELDHCQQQLEENRTQQTKLREEIEQGKAAIARDGRPLSDAGLTVNLETVETELHRLAEEETALQARKASVEQAQQEQTRAHQAQKEARTNLDAVQVTLMTTQKESQSREKALNDAVQALENTRANWTALCERIQPLLTDDWTMARVSEQPTLFVASLEQRVQTASRKQADETQARDKLTELSNSHSALAERDRQELEQGEEIGARFEEQRREQERLTLERSTILGGRPVSEVMAAQAKDLESATNKEKAKQEALNEIAKYQHAQQQRSEDLAATLPEAKVEVANARAHLDEQLAKSRLDEAALRGYLVHDPNWCEEQKRHLEQLTADHTQAQTRHQTLVDQMTRHQATLEPIHQPEALAEMINQQKNELEECERQKIRHEEALRADYERQQQAQELQPRYLKQRNTVDLWASISDLIGSHDGANFRRFAQSLSLDILLDAANHHLTDLNRRYALRRVPGEDLALEVVDMDMGGEARSVAGLSGGETFLVSLSLALGLASLNAHGAQIESLFIDEGFGALDPHALDTALAMLEQLQATGRQVGIISHVGAVAERVHCRVRVIRRGSGSSILRLP